MVMERPTLGRRVFSEAFLGLRNAQMRRRPFLIYQLACVAAQIALASTIVSFYEILSLKVLCIFLIVAILLFWVWVNTLAKRFRDIGMKYAWLLALALCGAEHVVINYLIDSGLWARIFSILLILAIGAIPSNYARRHQ
ncbi:hypothetical protein SOASR030_09020 [Leminorella grimontii]|uniref:DUF805 domain-containing protein n=2 Tax=Leminorella grimontii TaxID=82981 RepID=A0AAV5MYM1_9GAMM|nr:hypothetical protein GLGR_1202 [Leminorella grimontii ATCC 33999 = DSM 5078]GKX54790.1 hypothetical protein SOASR030_09020 [Leminorella grimontii]VFS58443.1 Uncharacterised protein [Leminorella grimontii]